MSYVNQFYSNNLFETTSGQLCFLRFGGWNRAVTRVPFQSNRALGTREEAANDEVSITATATFTSLRD